MTSSQREGRGALIHWYWWCENVWSCTFTHIDDYHIAVEPPLPFLPHWSCRFRSCHFQMPHRLPLLPHLLFSNIMHPPPFLCRVVLWALSIGQLQWNLLISWYVFSSFLSSSLFLCFSLFQIKYSFQAIRRLSNRLGWSAMGENIYFWTLSSFAFEGIVESQFVAGILSHVRSYSQAPSKKFCLGIVVQGYGIDKWNDSWASGHSDDLI